MLALRYRPRTFSAIHGQPQVQVILREQVALNRVPEVMLFSGSFGTGKTTAGRILAAALNCQVSNPEPCGECPSCESIYDGTSLMLIEIDAATHGGVEDIRLLKTKLNNVHNGVQVLMLDEAQSLTTNAQNALLKLFEDMPPDTHVIMVTTEENRILDTIKSRAMPFKFHKIPIKATIDRLNFICTQENIRVETDLISKVAQQSQGSLRNAIMMLDQISSVNITTVDQYSELMQETDFAPGLIAFMLNGNPDKVSEIVDYELSIHGDYTFITSELIYTLRDVITLKSGGTIDCLGKRLSMRQTLAAHMDSVQAVSALKLLWDLRTKLRMDDQKSSVLLATVLLTEILCGGIKSKTVTEDPDRLLTMEEFRSIR